MRPLVCSDDVYVTNFSTNSLGFFHEFGNNLRIRGAQILLFDYIGFQIKEKRLFQGDLLFAQEKARGKRMPEANRKPQVALNEFF